MKESSIKILRESRGWTQRYLAKLVGVSPAAVTRWEGKSRQITLGHLRTLARLFDTDIETIVGTEKDPLTLAQTEEITPQRCPSGAPINKEENYHDDCTANPFH